MGSCWGLARLSVKSISVVLCCSIVRYVALTHLCPSEHCSLILLSSKIDCLLSSRLVLPELLLLVVGESLPFGSLAHGTVYGVRALISRKKCSVRVWRWLEKGESAVIQTREASPTFSPLWVSFVVCGAGGWLAVTIVVYGLLRTASKTERI